MTAVNLLHVLTQDLEPTPVPATKDTLEMEKHAKVFPHLCFKPHIFLLFVQMYPTVKRT